MQMDLYRQAPVWTPSVIAAVLASISVYLQGWASVETLRDNLSSFFDTDGEQFDFIVVGAGSAGGVVAHRLAEAGHKVLLLEAGGGINPFQTIPAMSLLMLNYPSIDWKHKTVPQKHSCFSLPNNESHWSQGKGLGGTSNLNFLIQSRGNPADFENWANITGDPSWSYEGVLPYFRASESYYGRWNSEKTHGQDGPVRIAIPEYTGMADLYVRAAKELGYSRADLNGYYTEGFDTIFYPITRGARHGVFAAFIDSAPSGMTVRPFSYVKRILINKKNQAYGVEYDRHGYPKRALASKEVILSAGAMNSPKILMLSGVGPKDELTQQGITVKAELPVGKNLQDHISTYLGPFFIDKPITFSLDRDVNSASILQFFSTGTGVLTTSGTQAMGFISSTKAKEVGEEKWPDIQLILAGVSIEKKFSTELSRGFGLRKDIMDEYFKHAIGHHSFLQIVSLGRPHARGEVGLYSDHPYAPARINPSYLDNDHDIQVLVEGIKKAVDIVEKTVAFKKISGRFTNESLPGCKHIEFRTDEYWECYARHFSLTLHHIVGSCSMGSINSTDSVVDTELRVKGVKRLRVIDASVMPVVPVGNTNAPTIMIGEKGAAMIIKAWPPPEPEVTEAGQTGGSSTATTVTDEPTTEGDEEEEEEGDPEDISKIRLVNPNIRKVDSNEQAQNKIFN